MEIKAEEGVIVSNGKSDVVEASNATPVPEAPSSNVSKEGNVQFGRFVNVEILDFKSGNKTTIGNVFEIEFSFFKTIDHVKEDDVGKIKIYGLTKDRIKSFQSSGGEVRVYAGYLYGEVKPVFVGRIVRLYGEISNGVTVTTIECSSNMLNHYLTGVVLNDGQKVTSVGKFMNNVARVSGYPKAVFDARDVPVNDMSMVKEFLYNHLAPNSLVGDVFTLSQKASAMFGFEIMGVDDGGVKTFVVKIGDKALKVIKELTSKGYSKGLFNNTSIEDVLEFTMETPSDINTATVLNHTSGLISSSIEYKITKAFADQELGSNEEETMKSQADRQATLAKFEESEAKRKAEAEKKGKTFVPKDPPKSLSEKYVNRKYNKVKALFNPDVRPQGLVVVYDSFDDEYSVYRVRSMTISCNNKKGNWTMDLNCEDSRNLALTAEQIKQIESMQEQELATSAPEQQPISNSPVAGSTRRDQAMRFFMSKGWTKNQSAGIVANLEAESYSRLDHTVWGDFQNGAYQAYGIAQWHPDRRANFAKVFGRNMVGSSFEQQLEFVHWELNNTHAKNAGRLLRESTTAYQAGSVVTIHYEVPADRFNRAVKRGNKAEAIAKTY